jgi:hypothetical protein
MTDKEAMKQALEALENSIDLVSNEAREAEKMYANVPTRLARVQGLVALEVAHEKAIAALKERLAQPAPVQDSTCNETLRAQGKAYPRTCRKCGLGPCIGAPVQEPVAWGVDWGKDGNSVSIIKRLSDGNIEVLAWEYAPHPPQRTWVGLTDEEMKDALTSVDAETKRLPPGFRDFARNIEAKLKEKNFD